MKNTTNNETQIRQLIENWAKAVRDNDIDAILVHHDDNIIMFDVPEPFQSIGIDAYRKTWDMFFNYAGRDVFDIQHLDIVADENVAFCIAKMKCLDKNGDGDLVPLYFRLTIGLKKINGQWTVVHEHHSVPAT